MTESGLIYPDDCPDRWRHVVKFLIELNAAANFVYQRELAGFNEALQRFAYEDLSEEDFREAAKPATTYLEVDQRRMLQWSGEESDVQNHFSGLTLAIPTALELGEEDILLELYQTRLKQYGFLQQLYSAQHLWKKYFWPKGS